MSPVSPNSSDAPDLNPTADSSPEAVQSENEASLAAGTGTPESNHAVAYLRSAIKETSGPESKGNSRRLGFLRSKRSAAAAAAVRTTLSLNTPGLTEPDIGLFALEYVPAFTAETEGSHNPAETEAPEPLEATPSERALDPTAQAELEGGIEPLVGTTAVRPTSLPGEVLPPELFASTGQSRATEPVRIITVASGVRQPVSEAASNEPA